MKVSVNWLREYLDFDMPIEELADRLTMAGLEVEEIARLGRGDFASQGGSGSCDDTVFDVCVTPNRGDWLSMIGVAREAAPLVGSRLKMPEPSVDGVDPPSSDLIKIDIKDPDLCGRYVGVVVRNVEIKDSPDWMKDRLIASGMRPINNVVDVTNYVMLELGQPLHAFDYSFLRGRQIIVRRAEPGETITSIDGVQRKLERDTLVIADADRVVAIAGVMGGFDSEVSDQTQDILIESANFNPVSIRRTSKRLGMVTESSYRFERTVDPSITAIAALRAAELMRDLAGGEIARGAVDARPRSVEPLVVSVRPDRVNAVLGTSIDPEAQAGYLNGLEIETALKGAVLECRVPTFRQDITREIDLVEEIGRAYGFDNLEMTLPDVEHQGKDSPEGKFAEKIRRILISCGAQEALTHSLVDSKLADVAGKREQCLKVRNPLSEELDAMRVALMPNLLQVIQRNQAFGTADVSVFEVGKVYFQTPDDGIDERASVAAAMVGSLWGSGWNLGQDAFEVDFFACKGVVENILDGLGIACATFEPATDPLLHPVRAAQLVVEDRKVGILGEVSPDVVDALGLRGRPCAFELDFEALMQSAPSVMGYSPLARYPALHRHLAVVVEDSVTCERLLEAVQASGENMVENVELLDVYKGEQISPDRKSLTLSIVFRSRDRTLTDEEVNGVLAGIKEVLERDVDASFR